MIVGEKCLCYLIKHRRDHVKVRYPLVSMNMSYRVEEIEDRRRRSISSIFIWQRTCAIISGFAQMISPPKYGKEVKRRDLSIQAISVLRNQWKTRLLHG